jgi:hypothetical protein
VVYRLVSYNFPSALDFLFSTCSFYMNRCRIQTQLFLPVPLWVGLLASFPIFQIFLALSLFSTAAISFTIFFSSALISLFRACRSFLKYYHKMWLDPMISIGYANSIFNTYSISKYFFCFLHFTSVPLKS